MSKKFQKTFRFQLSLIYWVCKERNPLRKQANSFIGSPRKARNQRHLVLQNVVVEWIQIGRLYESLYLQKLRLSRFSVLPNHINYSVALYELWQNVLGLLSEDSKPEKIGLGLLCKSQADNEELISKCPHTLNVEKLTYQFPQYQPLVLFHRSKNRQFLSGENNSPTTCKY